MMYPDDPLPLGKFGWKLPDLIIDDGHSGRAENGLDPA
jgi:hypothetical protein